MSERGTPWELERAKGVEDVDAETAAGADHAGPQAPDTESTLHPQVLGSH